MSVHLDEHYVEPRLVALYDRDNPRGIDTDFYLNLASEIRAKRIIDLGCGTGILTCELAVDDREIIGVDPSVTMLAEAKKKVGAERVLWINGIANDIGQRNADLAVMTSNVAQVFLDEDEWASTLSALHGALRPGGYLSFESRNPKFRAWERWGRDDTYERIDTPFGPMRCWLDVVHVGDGMVKFEAHNIFESTGETIVAESVLRFRSEREITDSLQQAGFVVKELYGDWHRGPFLADESPLMIYVAQRT